MFKKTENDTQNQDVIDVVDKKQKRKMPKTYINGIMLSIVEIVIGILLLIKPEEFTRGIIIAVGIVLTILGIINIIDYFMSPVHISIQTRTLLSGLIYMILGLFCACNSAWFISTFPALTVLYGIIILLVGLSNVQDTVDLIRLKSKHWILPCILGAISIIFACLIFANPFGSTQALWTFVAISIILEAVFEITTTLIKYFKEKKN